MAAVAHLGHGRGYRGCDGFFREQVGQDTHHKTARLFNATATGLCVQLPGWNYPVVANLETGQVQYDNYGGAWGAQKHLNAFLQAYAVEKAKIEARKKGHSCSETRLEDGSIRVTVRVGGAA